MKYHIKIPSNGKAWSYRYFSREISREIVAFILTGKYFVKSTLQKKRCFHEISANNFESKLPLVSTLNKAKFFFLSIQSLKNKFLRKKMFQYFTWKSFFISWCKKKFRLKLSRNSCFCKKVFTKYDPPYKTVKNYNFGEMTSFTISNRACKMDLNSDKTL